jgi:hypothetical protein
MTRSTQQNTTLLLKIYSEYILHTQHINPRLKNILPYKEPDLKKQRKHILQSCPEIQIPTTPSMISKLYFTRLVYFTLFCIFQLI